jgi:hypothetical protein
MLRMADTQACTSANSVGGRASGRWPASGPDRYVTKNHPTGPTHADKNLKLCPTVSSGVVLMHLKASGRPGGKDGLFQLKAVSVSLYFWGAHAGSQRVD